MELVYISGGQRSGKSRFAQQLAEEANPLRVYLATARIWDDDFAQRVKRHQADRGHGWHTLEIQKEISRFPLTDFKNQLPVVVLDCVTLWLTNYFTDNQGHKEKTLEQAKSQWDNFMKLPLRVYAVSNEIGMGLHSETPLGRDFTDVQGFMNQYISKQAVKAFFMVSGRALELS
ncbi:MAG: bifunctional adenosylcobinamide kinase/adenosylcobinamide-phosphate guanylyltransferase [Spirochaetales bacterium]|nr:bifunctional adenosylcobinamide kinase/adenosylcobinamide-phosphate guanylyltransferase [Spirochaetales bacterium]